MRAVASIASGVRILPLDTPQGLRYRLKPASRGAGTVAPPRTLVAVMLMDGRRELHEIHDALRGLGVRIVDPAKLLAMVRLFEAAGVIDIAHHYETPGPLRHECEGCGRSCEGHLVGPIENDEAAELEARLVELREAHPEMPDGPATVEVAYEQETHRVLSFPDGVCIFLDADKRCRLHARWGANSKPLPCRMFPIRMVRTESGTRVAVSPRCFRAHHSYRSAPPTQVPDLLAGWEVWRPPALVQGLDPDKAESLVRSEVVEASLAAERVILGLLDGGSPDLADLLSVVARGQDSGPRPDRGRRRVFGGAVLATMQEALRGRFSAPERRRTSRFGVDVADFVAALPRLTAARLEDWNDLPPEALDFARHGLRHFVFAREVMAFGSFSTGVLAYAMGVMAARWLTPRDDLEAGRLDDFVTRVTVWVRLSGSREFQDVLFPTPTRAGALLKALIEGSRHG